MNQFKEDLLKELQDVKLSQQRKQLIADKARRQGQRKTGGEWTYRLVLATFTVFVIGFSYILTQQKEQRTTGQQAASTSSDTWHWWSLFDSDYVRGMLLLGIFIGATFIVKRLLVKKDMAYLFVLNVGRAGLRKMHVSCIAKMVKLCALIVDKNNIAQKIYSNQWCDDDASAVIDYAAACFPTFCYRTYFLFSGHVLLSSSNCAICV